jgi:hypothetical protein
MEDPDPEEPPMTPEERARQADGIARFLDERQAERAKVNLTPVDHDPFEGVPPEETGDEEQLPTE